MKGMQMAEGIKIVGSMHLYDETDNETAYTAVSHICSYEQRMRGDAP